MSNSEQQAMQIEEMAFVRAVADRLGIEVGTLARAYENLRACTKGTYFEGQLTREVFAATAHALSLDKEPSSLEVALGGVAAAVRTGNFDLQEAAALNAMYDRELRRAAEAAGLIAKTQDGLGKGPGN
jgi:DNA-binding transcriptional regulator YhcF (GntR family)